MAFTLALSHRFPFIHLSSASVTSLFPASMTTIDAGSIDGSVRAAHVSCSGILRHGGRLYGDLRSIVGGATYFQLFESVRLVRITLRLVAPPLASGFCASGVVSNGLIDAQGLVTDDAIFASPTLNLLPFDSQASITSTWSHTFDATWDTELKCLNLGRPWPRIAICCYDVPNDALPTAAAPVGPIAVRYFIGFDVLAAGSSPAGY